jgi:hypothetical protein
MYPYLFLGWSSLLTLAPFFIIPLVHDMKQVPTYVGLYFGYSIYQY